MTLTGPSLIPENPQKAVVLLHGYGADGQDLFALAPLLKQQLKNGEHTAFFAPNAPQKTNMGIGYQWFSDNDFTFVDRDGIGQAKELLEDFIQTEIIAKLGLKYEDVAIISFSQGTMTSLFSVPRFDDSIGALVGFSGLLMWQGELEKDGVNHVPILLVHGADDDVVPAHNTEQAAKELEALGYTVEQHILPGLPHGIDARGLELAATFLNTHNF